MSTQQSCRPPSTQECELPLLRKDTVQPRSNVLSKKAARVRRKHAANFDRIQTRARNYRIASAVAVVASILLWVETQSFGIGYSFFVLFALGTTGLSVNAPVRKLVLVLVSYTLFVTLLYLLTRSGIVLVIASCGILQTNQTLFPPNANTNRNDNPNADDNNTAGPAPNISLEQWELFAQKCQAVAQQMKHSSPSAGEFQFRHRTPPLDGWYVLADNHRDHFCLQFIAVDDENGDGIGPENGWQVLGSGSMGSGSSSKPMLIDDGFLSPSYKVYWVAWPQDNLGRSALLFQGAYDPLEGFSVSIQYLDGRISEAIALVPISQTNCKSHFGVVCAVCKASPIENDRFNVRSQGYDLCQNCMAEYDRLALSNDDLPPKAHFEVLTKPEQDPYPLRPSEE